MKDELGHRAVALRKDLPVRKFNQAYIIACCFAALFCACSATHAAGQGRTKIDFKLNIGDPSNSRLFAKLDVSAGVAGLSVPASGRQKKGGGNDALAGYTVNLIIGGSATFSGLADDKGKVHTPFDAKLTANGAIMQIKATGLNLEQLFPIDATDGDHQVTVPLKVTATKTDAGTGAISTVVLSDQNVIFFYTVRNGKAKGRNF